MSAISAAGLPSTNTRSALFPVVIEPESPSEHATEGGHQPGNYAIVAAMGAGGMGEVYRARDTRPERDIAVKGYRKRSRAIPSACSGTARGGTAKPATTPPLSRCCSMRRRNAVAYMRSNVILNFSVLATAPPVSAIDLPSAATV